METLWREIQAELQEQLDPGQYKVWVAPLGGRLEGTCFAVYAKSEFVASFVRSRLLPVIGTAIAKKCGTSISVEVRVGSPVSVVPTDDSVNLEESTPVIERPVFVRRLEGGSAPAEVQVFAQGEQLVLPITMPEGGIQVHSWRHSFDNFIVGPSNELAFAASRSLCRDAADTDLLFLSSAPGLGKTHLMQGVGQELCRTCNIRMPRVEYLTAEEFASRLVMSIKTNSMDRFKARHRDIDVLLLEDVHFLQGKEKMQDELLATLKSLNDKGSKVVFTSSFMPRDLRNMSDQLLSRLGSGFLAVIDRPTRETRKRILQEKARCHQVLLPEDVTDFLATHIDSDVRQIESCIHNLVLKAKLLNTGITMQLAYDTVSNYAPREKNLDIEGIIRYVCQGFGVMPDAMHSKSRRRDLVTARNTVFYLARKHTCLSLEEIGTRFNRSHSTVIKGITTLEREMSRETPLGRQMVSTIAIIERNGGIISPPM